MLLFIIIFTVQLTIHFIINSKYKSFGDWKEVFKHRMINDTFISVIMSLALTIAIPYLVSNVRINSGITRVKNVSTKPICKIPKADKYFKIDGESVTVCVDKSSLKSLSTNTTKLIKSENPMLEETVNIADNGKIVDAIFWPILSEKSTYIVYYR